MHDITPVKEFGKRYLDNSYFNHAGHLNHNEQFRAAGYYGVNVSTQHWHEMHQWMQANYPDRYCWTGNTFWFDDEQIAMATALRWT